jgi:glycine cleavage system transcriptional repressor
MFPHDYVLNVVAEDRPGIIAAVTAAVVRLGGNVEACSQTVVAGYFTLIMVVSLPEPIEAAHLAERVAAADHDVRLDVIARRCAGRPPGPGGGGEHFVITASGRDAPGVLNRFSEYLRGKDINIVDFFSEIQDGALVVITQVEVPPRWEIPSLQADLEQIADELGYTVRLQHENVFVATNQLRLAP